MIHVSSFVRFKEAMCISLEVSSDGKYFPLKEWVQSIPNDAGLSSFELTPELEESVRSCIDEFKKTKTYFWLREDFKTILYDVELQLNKKA
ncbi:hypothetical protein BABA_15182 [Neobacillus bataviensis LMG 21833]|uniref:Uncharacterized protein n=1 Tax=Neobacillus bataviensis LMG 21833 TaxID=1117379 RepID=K6DDT1_9BACI|nr:hypothetical protein [Neobacillus bataviensis]EKN66464.1 hypothetical protein BABA_15182 [Neobacillus bataviensis LMG 21833]